VEHFYIIGTIVFTVYGQLILKWRIAPHGALPASIQDKILFLVQLLMDPFIISGLAAAFVASLFWMAAMTKFNLSYAYPFMSIPFVLILFLSAFFFQEAITVPKLIGMIFIIVGITIGAKF